MYERFSKQAAISIAVVVISGIFKAGALVVMASKYSAAGPWMDTIGSIIIAAYLAYGIRSIARNCRRLKWKPVPRKFKAVLIGYHVLIVTATISLIVDHAGRPHSSITLPLLSSVTLILSAVLFTMFAMANFTPQND